jgi:dTMP kinase
MEVIRMFVAFEGLDRCGKSTQSRLFCKYLEDSGIKHVFVREPGGTELGEKIRVIELTQDMCDKSELLLFLASRAQLVESVLSVVDDEVVVVADRFIHSTLAYQGYGRGIDLGVIRMLNDFATGGMKPDLVFLLDIQIYDMMSRMKNKDRIEKEDVKFWERVRAGYLEMAEQEGFVVIDGTKNEEEISNEIIGIFEDRWMMHQREEMMHHR